MIGVGAIAALLLAIAIALVSGGDTEKLSGAEIADAADATIRAGGARVEMSMKMKAPGAAQNVTIKGSGVDDMTGKHAQLSMDMWPLAQQAPEQDRGTRDDWQMEAVFDYPLMYMRFPIVAKELGHGKSWIKMDLEETAQAAGIDKSLLNTETQNPAQQVQYLRTVGGEVEKLGSETIDGVKTTHYRGEVDLRRYPKLVPARDRKRAEASVKRLIELSGGQAVTPVEVWIGRDRLVRRVSTSLTQTTGGQKLEIDQTIDYRDFGTRIRIEKPPADEVADVTDLAKKELEQQP